MANFTSDYFANRKKITPTKPEPTLVPNISQESQGSDMKLDGHSVERVFDLNNQNDSKQVSEKNVTIESDVKPIADITKNEQSKSDIKLDNHITKKEHTVSDKLVKISYNKSKHTSDVKNVSSDLLLELKRKLKQYGVSGNTDAVNVFIAGMLDDYRGLTYEQKEMAKVFRQGASQDQNLEIIHRLSRIESKSDEVSRHTEYLYYMIHILGMYALNNSGISSMLKSGFIDFNEPSVLKFVKATSENFSLFMNDTRVSDGRPKK